MHSVRNAHMYKSATGTLSRPALRAGSRSALLTFCVHFSMRKPLVLQMSHPSNVGTPSWRAPCRLGTSRTCGCCELRGCCAETSWSLLASLPRLLSAPSRIRRSKLSSKIPKVNGPNPGGNVNTGWGAAL